MKKTIVGLTAIAALATSLAFVPTPADARDDGWRGGDRQYSRHYDRDRRHWRRGDRDGVWLRFGSPGPYRCHTYWRHGRKYRSCEPRGGVTFGFGF